MASINASALKNVQNHNFFEYTPQFVFRQGNAYTFYLQLNDEDQALGFLGDFNAPTTTVFYNRYLPAAGSSLTLTFNDLNSANVVTKIASQPFTDDLSIWSFSLAASETTNMSGGNIVVTLTENSNGFTFTMINAAVIIPLNPGSC